MLCERLSKQGLQLSAKERRQLLKAAHQGHHSVTFKRWSWAFWKTNVVSLRISEEDLAAIDRAFHGFDDAVSESVIAVADELTVPILSVLRRRWPRQHRRESRAASGFRDRLANRWFEPLDLLAMMLAIAREFGAMQSERLHAQKDVAPAVLDVVTRLHARSCQVADEVLVLLQNGFADGAMARWRTLHEIAVTALFIADGDENTAERYAAYEVVEALDAARDYRKHADSLGVEPIEDEELIKLQRRCNELCELYGEAFKKPFGWAAHRFNNTGLDFDKIAGAVHVGHWLPYVNLAHQSVHAGPKGVFFQLGQLGEPRVLLAGASNYGLADPGQSTCFAILQATAALLRLGPTVDAIVTVRILESLTDEAAVAFVRVQKEIEAEQESSHGS